MELEVSVEEDHGVLRRLARGRARARGYRLGLGLGLELGRDLGLGLGLGLGLKVGVTLKARARARVLRRLELLEDEGGLRGDRLEAELLRALGRARAEGVARQQRRLAADADARARAEQPLGLG